MSASFDNDIDSREKIRDFCCEIYKLAQDKISKDGYIIALKTLISIEIEEDESILASIIGELHKRQKMKLEIINNNRELN